MNFSDFDPLFHLSSWKLFLLVSTTSFLIIFFRLLNIQNLPPVITIDEASIGINAASILEKGQDEFGIDSPLFFKAFGEYKSPIFIYGAVPFIKLFGLNLYALRLAAAIWGILTVGSVAILIWQITKNKTATFIALIVIGLIPWHFQISHLSYEVVTLPFFLTMALLLLIKARNQSSNLCTSLGALFFGLMLYSYPTARILAPFYALLALCLLLEKPLQRLLFLTVFVVTAAPFLIAAIQNPPLILSRFGEISVFSQNNPGSLFASNFLSYFSPSYLLIKGSNDILFSTQRTGSIFISLAAPLLFGLGYLINKSRRDITATYLLISLVTFPLAAALTFDNQPHLLRAVNALPFIVVIISIGIWYLLKTLPKAVSTFLITLFIIEVGLYLYDFNKNYPDRVKNDVDLKQVVAPDFNRENLLKFYKV